MESALQTNPDVESRAKAWLVESTDDQTKAEVRRLLEGNPNELAEAFQYDLEFGTGGLRGVMGVGTSRMNRYTVGKATQGLANYINTERSDAENRAVAIAFDSRNNSLFFARTAADVLTANGIRVFLFPELRPTPFLSFAVRQLNCTAGIVITASHNPPEYNGYKVYWEDGAQVLPPHDKGIMKAVRSIGGMDEIRFTGNPELLITPPPALEEDYYGRLTNMVFARTEIAAEADLSIVYTSLHGAGITMVPEVLRRVGFRQIHIVAEQAAPDGNFPTVESPNPEERAALDLALQLATRERAELVMGTDPDTDRVGIAIRNEKGELELLNGNQAGALLVWYELTQWKNHGMLKGNQYIASTIVTS